MWGKEGLVRCSVVKGRCRECLVSCSVVLGGGKEGLVRCSVVKGRWSREYVVYHL